MAKRRRYLYVCTNRRAPGTPKGSCATRGSEEIHAALKAEVAARGLAKTEVRICTSSCTDVCWAGPVVMVTPDDYAYGRVTLADVGPIVDALEKGERVERLVLPAHDYTESTADPMIPELPAR